MNAKKPGFVEPMKALGVTRIPPGRWLLENKFDGYRALAVRTGKKVRLYSRNGNDLTGEYPEIAEAVGRLPCRRAVLDGEVVALDRAGRPRFQLLQQRMMGEASPPLFYYLFDLLQCDGRSFVHRPIEERRAELSRLMQAAPHSLRLSPVFDLAPARLLAKVRAKGLEGIVAKAAGSAYEAGRRSGAWLKCRVSVEQEFVIGGYTPPQKSRLHFGAILVGYYQEGRLVYAGKVGTGFDGRTLARLHESFRALASARCPFGTPPEGGKRASWITPRLVAQIRFSEWTDDGRLRQPVYLGMRTDKVAREVGRETSAA